MENLGYYNGKFGPLEEMMVPMNDRVCYFGDGVYEDVYKRQGLPNMKRNADDFAISSVVGEGTKITMTFNT